VLGTALNTIILSSSILYELVGPVSAKLGLYLSKSYSNDIDEAIPVDDKGLSTVDRLIKQIGEIRKQNKLVINENEAAFTEAALDYNEGDIESNNFMNHRRRR